MKAYYTIFDVDNQLVGLAGNYIDYGLTPNLTSNLPPAPPTIPPIQTQTTVIIGTVSDAFAGYIVWIAVGIVGFIALLVLAYMIHRYCLKKSKSPVYPEGGNDVT